MFNTIDLALGRDSSKDDLESALPVNMLGEMDRILEPKELVKELSLSQEITENIQLENIPENIYETLKNSDSPRNESLLSDLALGPNRTSLREVDLASRGLNSSKDEFEEAIHPHYLSLFVTLKQRVI
jgi:hypothetical protein